jgi:hypothetical protein
MSNPEFGSILQQYEASRKEENTFQTQRDFDAQRRWVEEQAERLGAAVHLFVTSTQRAEGAQNEAPFASGGVDPLYGDILDPSFHDAPDERDQRQINIRCIVEHQPSKQSLKKYGIDEQREVIFHFPLSVLKDKGLVTPARFRGVDIGDLVQWDDSWYIVVTSHRSAYFGQTTGNYFTAAAAERYRPNSVPIDNPANNDPEETE